MQATGLLHRGPILDEDEAVVRKGVYRDGAGPGPDADEGRGGRAVDRHAPR